MNKTSKDVALQMVAFSYTFLFKRGICWYDLTLKLHLCVLRKHSFIVVNPQVLLRR